MKKLLSIILMVTILFALSCNRNKLNSSSTSPIGRVGEIVVDPNGVTPLSAVYTTATVNAAPITVTVKGLYGEPDIIHTYPAGYGTEFEIHGMFPESQNTIEVNDGGRIITKNVYVPSLPNGIQKKYDVEINNLPEEKYPNNPELYFIGNSSGAIGTYGISRNGYLRYVMLNIYPSKIVKDNNSIILYTEHHNDIRYLSGKPYVRIQIAQHHDTIKVGNNYMYLANSKWGIEDRLIEINKNGSLIRDLNFGTLIKDIVKANGNQQNEVDILNKIVFDANNIHQNSSGQQIATDWCHANSLVYDSSTDILYVSSRNRGVLAIDYSEWKLIWWMADKTLQTRVDINSNTPVGFIPYDVHLKDLKSLEPYRVKGAGMDDGPKNQHALFLLANGNLGMFDNQGDEDTNPNGSRYVEYKITGTHGNYTAQKVYEYRNSSFYSRVTSDVDFTGENYQNILITYGYPNGRILEVEKNSRKILFKLVVPYFLYRSDKMPLYYDEGRVYSEDCNLKNPN
ncbi:aryl-sulfate sulfotransferase [Brachyspira murdochii]|uniref:aryl-sulfate sulfotransferase n=1 Tax=Brachyspira murdochii TaxID=84378 RepID=UPI0012F4D384|nr:aryl-sulfate sulfotransferase [Brachyspira murdochii]